MAGDNRNIDFRLKLRVLRDKIKNEKQTSDLIEYAALPFSQIEHIIQFEPKDFKRRGEKG